MKNSTLKQRLSRLLAEAAGLPETYEVQWLTPKHEGQGDLSTNLALIQGKRLGEPPRRIAEAILAKLDVSGLGVSRVEVAGPGFINFWIGPDYYRAVVAEILRLGGEYGCSDFGRQQRVLVEFVSANPTGPLNVVSARAASIGDSLVRVMKKAGFDAHSEYYVNDTGRQIRRLGHSIIAVFRGEPVPEDGYHGADVAEHARRIFADREYAQNPDPDETGGLAAEWNVRRHRRVLEMYGVHFDRWFYESELHAEGAADKVLELLQHADAVYEKDGAVWFAGSRFGDEEDRVLITREGRATYLLPDIAYHLDKAERGFEKAIDLLGPDHLDYTGRMAAAMSALGYPNFFEPIIVQQVHLLSGGKRVKMSKRAGKLITLEELIDEVGVDVARYFFLQRRTSTPLEFDLDLAKEQSDRNPVYYVQYAHTRICGILRQDGCPEPVGADLSPLGEPEELALIKHLDRFVDIVERAAESREPQKLTGYLHDLATTFHKFYTAHRVVGAADAVSAARAALVEASRIVLAEGLNLLGVSAPERM